MPKIEIDVYIEKINLCVYVKKINVYIEKINLYVYIENKIILHRMKIKKIEKKRVRQV